MFSKKITVFTLLAFLGVCNGFGLSLGSCPDVQGMPNFDLQKYMGLWYNYASTELDSNCNLVTFTLNEDGSVGVLNKLIDAITGVVSNILGVAVPVKNAQLKVTTPLLGITVNDYILDTDYNTYSVVQTCNQITPLLHSTHIQVLVRDPNNFSTAEMEDNFLKFGGGDFDFKVSKCLNQ